MVTFYPCEKIKDIGCFDFFQPFHLKGIELVAKPEWINKIYDGSLKPILDRKSQTYSFA